MKVAWTKGLSGDEKKEIEADYNAAVYLRRRMTKILEDKIKIMQDKSISVESYDSPNWALKQADASGYIRAMQELIKNIK